MPTINKVRGREAPFVTSAPSEAGFLNPRAIGKEPLTVDGDRVRWWGDDSVEDGEDITVVGHIEIQRLMLSDVTKLLPALRIMLTNV